MSILDSHVFDTMDTERDLSSLRKYCDVMEAQMDEVLRMERSALDAQQPEDDEADQSLYYQIEHLEQVYEPDLKATMRYSFVVFIHIVLETRLRDFCRTLKQERKLPISLTDLRGSAVEQAQTFLTKLVGVAIGGSDEWQHLRILQKIRDCIVHAYGYVSASRDAQELRALAAQNVGLSIDHNERLVLTKEFCGSQLIHLETLFNHLFKAVGWKK